MKWTTKMKMKMKMKTNAWFLLRGNALSLSPWLTLRDGEVNPCLLSTFNPSHLRTRPYFAISWHPCPLADAQLLSAHPSIFIHDNLEYLSQPHLHSSILALHSLHLLPTLLFPLPFLGRCNRAGTSNIELLPTNAGKLSSAPMLPQSLKSSPKICYMRTSADEE